MAILWRSRVVRSSSGGLAESCSGATSNRSGGRRPVGQLAISCPGHLLHCLTDSNPLCIPFIGQSLSHDGPSTLEQTHSGLGSIRPRSPRSTRIRSNAMELVIGHELWCEKCLITYDSFRNAVVLLSPLTECSQSGASKLVRAVAHRRFEAPSMMTKARYALVPNLISS